MLIVCAVLSLAGCDSPADAQQVNEVKARVAVAAAEVQVIKDRAELPDDLEKPTEATPDDKRAAELQRVASRTNDIGEQIDGVGLALVETEDQLRAEIKQLREELTDLKQRFGQIENEHAKLWILMHTPPVVQGEADPVKEFMEAKRPEVFGFTPWFACPHCPNHKAYFASHKAPFDVIWGEFETEDDAKAVKAPANAGFPLYRVPTKKGDMWLWGFTPEQLIAEFERRNR
jgi:hypothetical protein